MPRDGAGNHSLPEADFVSGTTIVSAAMNSNLQDLSDEVANSVAKDGQSTMTGALKMGSQRITTLGDATARTDAAKVSQVQDGAYNYGTTGGTANAQTLTPSPAITAYPTGGRFWATIGSGLTNTGPATMQISGIASPRAITRIDGSALVGNELKEATACLFFVAASTIVLLSNTVMETTIVVTKSFAGNADLEFDLPSGFPLISWWGQDLLPAVQDEALRAQVAIAGTYQTSGSYTNNKYDNSSGTGSDDLTTTDTAILVSGGSDDNGTHAIGFTMELLSDPAGTALNKVFKYESYSVSSGSSRTSRDGHGYWAGAQSAINKVRFNYSGGGNGASGSITMTCRRKS